VKAALPEGGRSLLEAIPALRNRECIISGEGVPAPIRVRLDELEAAKRPMSAAGGGAAESAEFVNKEGRKKCVAKPRRRTSQKRRPVGAAFFARRPGLPESVSIAAR
jgi:hypothetical protein